MDKPTPDGKVIVMHMIPLFSDAEGKHILQPEKIEFMFADGWVRREETFGLKFWIDPAYRGEKQTQLYRILPWHTILDVRVICNSHHYMTALREWEQAVHSNHLNPGKHPECRLCRVRKNSLLPLYSGWNGEPDE